MEVSANRWHPLAFDAQSYGLRRTAARSLFWHTSVTASSPAPKGVSTRSHCKRVRKECGRTAGPIFDTCRSPEGVDVTSLKNRSGDPQITPIRYPRRSCRRSLLRRERHEWSDEIILLIAQVCVILHNMIVSMCKSGELDEEGGAEGGGNLVEKLCDDAPPAEGVDGAPVAAGAPVPEVGLLAPLDRAHTVKDDSSHVA